MRTPPSGRSIATANRLRRFRWSVAPLLLLCQISATSQQRSLSDEWAALQRGRDRVQRNWAPIVAERQQIELRDLPNALRAVSSCKSPDTSVAALLRSAEGYRRTLERERPSLEARRAEIEALGRQLETERVEIESNKRSLAGYEMRMLALVDKTHRSYLEPFESDVMLPSLMYLNAAREYLHVLSYAARSCSPRAALQSASDVPDSMLLRFAEWVGELQQVLRISKPTQ